MTFTKPRDLVLAGLLAAVVVHLLVRLFYSQLPPLPALGGITLLLLAIVEVVFAFTLRGRIRGTSPGKALQPLTAARAVALAKASSLLGAIMLGAWLGAFVYVLPLRDEIAAAGRDLPGTVVGMLCAGALIGAGLWLETCCRTPRDPDDQAGRRP